MKYECHKISSLIICTIDSWATIKQQLENLVLPDIIMHYRAEYTKCYCFRLPPTYRHWKWLKFLTFNTYFYWLKIDWITKEGDKHTEWSASIDIVWNFQTILHWAGKENVRHVNIHLHFTTKLLINR